MSDDARLLVAEVGISIDLGDVVDGVAYVILTGPVDEVRKAASHLDDEVTLTPDAMASVDLLPPSTSLDDSA